MKVIGHRGAAGLVPENTFAGFEVALKLGVDGIETDIQRTKDGKLVLFHDDRIDRTTNGTGMLEEISWEELQKLDAGSWFNMKYAGERVPLLIDVLERYGNRTSFDLEIKKVGIEDEVLAIVEQLSLLDRVTFTSPHFSAIFNIKSKNSQARVGYLTADFSDKNLEKVINTKIECFCPWAEGVTKHLVEKWHSSGFFVRAFGVDTVEIMRNLIRDGVDGMTINFPDMLLKELGRG